MAKITYNYDEPWVTAECSECGPFTAGVHKRNIRFLEAEAAEHLRKVHGQGK